jgi:hypothetical protein
MKRQSEQLVMFFLLLYINLYFHYVAHLTMTTFVQEHLLYLIVYPIKIVCSNTDIDLTIQIYIQQKRRNHNSKDIPLNL